MCASNPYPRELPKTQTTSPLAARFQCFSPRWSAFWVPRSSGRPLDGGNCTTRGCDTPATRRKRASCSAKPPPPPSWSAPAGPEGPAPVPMSGKAQQQDPRAAHFRYKTLPAHPLAPHVRYKTLPARAARPYFRYKTLPVHPKWLDLALFLHAGRVLYRCHRQEAEQGDFCTEREAELGLANRTPGPTRVEGAGGTGVEGAGGTGVEGAGGTGVEGAGGTGVEGAGGTGVEGTGGLRGTEPGRGAGGRWWSPAAVPTNDSSTQPKQISHAIPPRHESMHAQKPQNINDQTSTLEIHSGELHAKLVGEWPVGQQAASRRRACPLSGRSAAGEWPVGPQAASRRRACPLSGRSAPAQRLASGPAVPRPRIFSRSASPSEPYQTGMDSGTVHRASGTMASKLP